MATKSKELNIEDKLWKAADALRGSMDASEYRNVVLGLIFLKFLMSSLISFRLLVPSLIKEQPSVKRQAQLMKVKSLEFLQEKHARWLT